MNFSSEQGFSLMLNKYTMKIVFLIRSLDYGGAERQLVVLTKGLHERGYSVQVAVFYPKGPLEKDLLDFGVTVHVLNKRERWDVFFFLVHLIQFLSHEKPDILHSYLGIPNIFAVLLKPIFPSMRVVWGVRSSNVDLDRYDWLARLSYQVECRLSRFADLIIVNSHAGLDYAVAHGFTKNKMVVIHNGIDTGRFRPIPEARKRVRAEWGVSDNETLIGLVARLDPMKDHPTFIKAAALLIQERKDVRFVCVGDGPASYKSELVALANYLGLKEKLIWAGSRDDMPAVYNALDIASSSSYGEGLPNVIGEAMACGVPCVVTDVGDSAWIVGEMGELVEPKNPQALAETWNKMIMPHLAKNLVGQKVRERIVKSFGVDALVNRTIKAMESLI